jgi:hypothetical protein
MLHKELMNLAPHEVFPEDTLDPTVSGQKMSVEQTMGTVGYLRGITRKRSNWRFLVQNDPFPGSRAEGAEKIRKTYGLPETAPVRNHGKEWAVWAGKGEPDFEPFETPDTVPAEAMAGMQELVEALPEVAKQIVDVFVPSPSPAISTPPVPARGWEYSSKAPLTAEALRERKQARADAPVVFSQSRKMAAIWVGEGDPTSRAIFPDVPPIVAQELVVDPEKPSLVADSDTPESALHETGMQLYRLSEDPVYSEPLRKFLLSASNAMHAEAAKITVAIAREQFGKK